MDATAWVAIAGIAGTLTGALLGPVVAEKMRRKSARDDRMAGQRVEVYADLLRVTARIADNALGWSVAPLADMKETDDEELKRLISRVQVVASKDVHRRVEELLSLTGPFYRQLFQARLSHGRLLEEGTDADTDDTLNQRMALFSMAEKIIECHKGLLAKVRTEFDA